MALFPKRLISRLYQYSHIMTIFLYLALLVRWLILLPLVGSKFLPGGIHEFLCYLLVGSGTVDLFWRLWFHGLINGIISKSFVKNANLIYIVVCLHFYDDYEHSLILKNASYSSFIIGLSISQIYSHWTRLFKTEPGTKRKTGMWKFNAYCMLPLLYLSEFYLLLLNVQNYNFHTTPLLDIVNKAVLITFLPISITFYKNYLI
ncbi:hypothetical protein TBLA_0I03440 [Henningerozyma blattae CBS 6284]|uniref:Very-long-chain (3R)-3-hydroxyacyl-CoA dehydratase n=1 Tax=Henningerozyma blattae (strain ATCC 34711 / CBS 6284 / DSM 70876 / NBRC 10599 / NRRL Y-10934 / UCD 77-7) TaxID=1071380 RepID=I2H9E5_HENB6|nr:hypothetical protein TBLA_0I03440 [Tetrapisispora blattae CBS 6284]CCH62997.1 hypothetical protein TBLA_0I03440 [Tetrapisispora blattae CBS 6284]